MSIEAQGENLRKAVKWISEERTVNSQADLKKLVENACVRFNLSPKDEDFLLRFEHKDEA
jgi:hypothetical protein